MILQSCVRNQLVVRVKKYDLLSQSVGVRVTNVALEVEVLERVGSPGRSDEETRLARE